MVAFFWAGVVFGGILYHNTLYPNADFRGPGAIIAILIIVGIFAAMGAKRGWNPKNTEAWVKD